ncbi:hypothetical protein MCOR19_010830 [Pyricularia oryzae]|nr:hypothetical protein MCOR19_010830 [Pyricularia oryzae]KAI6467872.1 hypothetical protein MCOR18_009592 [Pyricularia oryzae]
MSNSTLNQVPNRANDRWANEVESVFGELAIDRHRARLQSRADVNIESMLPVVEKTLDAVWEASSLKNELDAISDEARDAIKDAWIMSSNFLGCLPTDIINIKSRLIAKDQGSKAAWSVDFARAFCGAVPGVLWKNNPDTLVTVLQYIVICRTKDNRKWPILAPCTDDFFGLLADEIHNKSGQESIPAVHGRVRSSHPESARSPFSVLFQEIEHHFAANQAEEMDVEEEDYLTYKVTKGDLEVVALLSDSDLGRSFVPGSMRYQLTMAAMPDMEMEQLQGFLEVTGKEALKNQSILASGRQDLACRILDRKPVGVAKRRGRPPKKQAKATKKPAMLDSGPKLGRPKGSKTRVMEEPPAPSHRVLGLRRKATEDISYAEPIAKRRPRATASLPIRHMEQVILPISAEHSRAVTQEPADQSDIAMEGQDNEEAIEQHNEQLDNPDEEPESEQGDDQEQDEPEDDMIRFQDEDNAATDNVQSATFYFTAERLDQQMEVEAPLATEEESSAMVTLFATPSAQDDPIYSVSKTWVPTYLLSQYK